MIDAVTIHLPSSLSSIVREKSGIGSWSKFVSLLVSDILNDDA